MGIVHFTSKIPPKYPKIGKNKLAHMVSYANGTDLKHFKMTFYDSLGVFKPIFGDFDFFWGSCAPLQPLITLPNNWDLPKSSKNMKNTSKYVFLASKCPEQLSKNGRNTHNACAKHFFEARIGFKATLGPF